MSTTSQIAFERTEMKEPNWDGMSTMELIRWHNSNVAADKKVKRFSDRKTAIRRCQKVFQTLPKVQAPKPQPAQRKAKPIVHGSPEDTAAAAIAASWLRPDIRAKRVLRHSVEVDGNEYGSVRQAFVELGLPLKEHIRFRMLLKKNKTSNNYGYTWNLKEKN